MHDTITLERKKVYDGFLRLLHWTIALSTVFWPWYARLVRGQVLSIRERDYIHAARSMGMSSWRLMLRHILPNAWSVVIIQVTLDVGYAILATSSLSFIGLGATPPTPEWGLLISENRDLIFISPATILGPGLMLASLVIGINLLTEGISRILGRTVAQRN